MKFETQIPHSRSVFISFLSHISSTPAVATKLYTLDWTMSATSQCWWQSALHYPRLLCSDCTSYMQFDISVSASDWNYISTGKFSPDSLSLSSMSEPEPRVQQIVLRPGDCNYDFSDIFFFLSNGIHIALYISYAASDGIMPRIYIYWNLLRFKPYRFSPLVHC